VPSARRAKTLTQTRTRVAQRPRASGLICECCLVLVARSWAQDAMSYAAELAAIGVFCRSGE
jgi:hypothetical protein